MAVLVFRVISSANYHPQLVADPKISLLGQTRICIDREHRSGIPGNQTGSPFRFLTQHTVDYVVDY